MGNQPTITDQIEVYLPEIRRAVYRVVGNSDDIEDLTQECCVQLITKEKLWKEKKGSLASWVRTVSKNLSLNFAARQKEMMRLDEDMAEKIESKDFSEEHIQWVLYQLSYLSPRQKEIITLRYMNQMKVKDIGDKLGIRGATVSKQLSLALDTLRKRARRQGLLSFLFPWNWESLTVNDAVKVTGVLSMKIKYVPVIVLTISSGYFAHQWNQNRIGIAQISEKNQMLELSQRQLRDANKKLKSQIVELSMGVKNVKQASEIELENIELEDEVKDTVLIGSKEEKEKTFKFNLQSHKFGLDNMMLFEAHVLTFKGIEDYLDNRGRKVEDLIAAASLGILDFDQSISYLNEAIKKDSHSLYARKELILAYIKAGRYSEDIKEHILMLEQKDPSGATAHYLKAYFANKSGNLEEMSAELEKAVQKKYITNFEAETASNRIGFYEEAGASPALSRVLATFNLSMPEITAYMELAKASISIADQQQSNQKYDKALSGLKRVKRLGESISIKGGISIINDLVGLKLQKNALIKEREIYSFHNNETELNRIDQNLKIIESRSSLISKMTQANRLISETPNELSEQEVLAYMNVVLLKGEFNAMMKRDEIKKMLGEME